MMELLVSSFRFDACPGHEQSLLVAPAQKVDRFCSKDPLPDDIRFARAAMRRNPELWIIVMLRDPRDVIVSEHRAYPGQFFSDLHEIRARDRLLQKVQDHPRLLLVRYEDLVRDPDAVQARLMREIPFLEKIADFSNFGQSAAPTEMAERALGGLRPVSSGSIGRWKQNPERIKGQIDKFGPIDDLLQVYGYEPDTTWRHGLTGVAADTSPGFVEKRRANRSRRDGLRLALGMTWRRSRFLMGVPKKGYPLRWLNRQDAPGDRKSV